MRGATPARDGALAMTTAPQPPHAPVLRRHREMAICCYWAQSDYREIHNGADYVERGDPRGIDPRILRSAQLAADCEASGEPGARHEAWNEGYLARSRRGLYADEPVNPYPKADARPLPAEGERT